MPPEVQEVLDLTEERNRRMAAAKAERRRKWGRRQSYAHMPYQDWKRKFDAAHMLSVLASLINQQPCGEPDNFRSGGVGLTPREWKVMASAISWHMRPQAGRGPLNTAALARLTRMGSAHTTRVVNALGVAGLIVNLAGNSAPNLAPNPDLGYWDLQRLPELRKTRRGVTSAPWSP